MYFEKPSSGSSLCNYPSIGTIFILSQFLLDSPFNVTSYHNVILWPFIAHVHCFIYLAETFNTTFLINSFTSMLTHFPSNSSLLGNLLSACDPFLVKPLLLLKGTVSPDIRLYFSFWKINLVLSAGPLMVLTFSYFVPYRKRPYFVQQPEFRTFRDSLINI